ncbi:glycoside hydrolase family 3 protein [Nakamurella lactea]|uniref:glycoside hydrolase family 3 protein n=1 Tax=Nakamurella lactea TaxID=459515 RepID=UPI0003F8E0D9|nr:glycoside hydrolase family 3 N-terminal domain-containing protein [Nakamurella lactea]
MRHSTRAAGLLVLAVAVTAPSILASAAAGAPAGAAPSGRHDQPAVSTKVKDVLTVDHLRFRDANGNGRLDGYEDWRRPVAQRIADLLPRMSLADKAGLMVADSAFTGDSASCPAGPDNGVLCETDGIILQPFPQGTMAVSTMVKTNHMRYLISRDNPTAHDLAVWTNAIQQVAESTPLGIPAVPTSNPRNHLSPAGYGLSEASGQFSSWPGTEGLAAMHDPALVGEFAKIAQKEWRAAGLRKMYGYQIDTVGEPRWTRDSGTFGENPQLTASYASALVKGFQGKKLGTDSVSLTIKHFPGNGSAPNGLDSHYQWGQCAVYPTAGSLFKYQVPQFKAAVDAGVSSVMTYYQRPCNDQSVPQIDGKPFAEEQGAAYNSQLINEVLRGKLGFKGYVNTDSGIIDNTDWGVQDLTPVQRVAEAINAGSDVISIMGGPDRLVQAVEQGLIPMSRIDQANTRLLTEIFSLGLFDNPYVDPDNAQRVADSVRSQKLADQAHRESVVLMRNDQRELPLVASKHGQIKLYVEVQSPKDAELRTAKLRETITAEDPSITLVDSPAKATDAFVWLQPSPHIETDSAGNQTDVSIDLADPTVGVNAARVRQIEAQVPTVLAINLTNPYVISSVERGAAAVVGTFDTQSTAVLDVIRGRYNPTGKLPVTVPASVSVVEHNAPDVPGYAEGRDYPYRSASGQAYLAGFGLSYGKHSGR